MKKLRAALVGIGNCASSLVQGIHYYSNAREGDLIPGLMHVNIGPYHVSDIDIVCGFDVDSNKVDKDISEAILLGRNNTVKSFEVPPMSAKVFRGPTLDGLGKYYHEVIDEHPSKAVNVAEVLKRHGVHVLINYLPVGSEKAAHFYVEEALKAACGVVNCIPVFVAKEEIWQGKFRRHGLPIVGDDIKSQVGATILHRVLGKLLTDRGVVLC